MRLHIDGFDNGGVIPERFAFGVMDPATHVRLGANLNPALRWSDITERATSLVLICVDSDVPTVGDDVNQEDREIPADLPRTRFYHWVMVDLAPTDGGVDEGACSDGVTARGKREPAGPTGSRQGSNDYTGWFASDADMAGDYRGYDGPCPPWNDPLVHHYHFELYALDLPRCPVDGAFDGRAVMKAIEGHVLAQVAIMGQYSLNPAVDIDQSSSE